MTDWRTEFLTARFIVALVAMAVFSWAFATNPTDQTMVGAIIGGFNLALGFYLGSTNTASRATENTGKLADAFKATAEAGTAPLATPDDEASA